MISLGLERYILLWSGINPGNYPVKGVLWSANGAEIACGCAVAEWAWQYGGFIGLGFTGFAPNCWIERSQTGQYISSTKHRVHTRGGMNQKIQATPLLES